MALLALDLTGDRLDRLDRLHRLDGLDSVLGPLGRLSLKSKQTSAPFRLLTEA